MANPVLEMVPAYPFTSFNFSVEIQVPAPGLAGMALPLSQQICAAAFQECDGLEMTMEAKSIREGGNNGTQIRLAGPVSYGPLTLKRGMTANFDLWEWFSATIAAPALRGDGVVVLLAPDGRTPRARFAIGRCLPVKLKLPALNAREGGVAIEELQLAYETLAVLPQEGP